VHWREGIRRRFGNALTVCLCVDKAVAIHLCGSAVRSCVCVGVCVCVRASCTMCGSIVDNIPWCVATEHSVRRVIAIRRYVQGWRVGRGNGSEAS
jgi:hypothetical protein